MLSTEAQKPAWRGLVSKFRMGIIGAATTCKVTPSSDSILTPGGRYQEAEEKFLQAAVSFASRNLGNLGAQGPWVRD